MIVKTNTVLASNHLVDALSRDEPDFAATGDLSFRGYPFAVVQATRLAVGLRRSSAFAGPVSCNTTMVHRLKNFALT